MLVEPGTAFCYADPRALKQIMLNLFTNAADALPGHAACVSVNVARSGDMVRFRVEDNGCGMTAEQQNNLFKPFFTTKTNGTGLGMVIVKKMLTQMNGHIELQSWKDEGTTVDVFIPRDGPSSDAER